MTTASGPATSAGGALGRIFFLPALLLLAAVLILTSGARAQPLTLVPPLAAGDAFSLLMSKTRERLEGGRTMARGRSETPIDVLVREATAEGWLIDWTFGATRIVEPANVSPPPDATLFDRITLRLRLDREGRPRSIENYPEVRRRVDGAINALLEGITDAGTRDRMAVVLRESLGSKEQIEPMLLTDVADYFLPYSVPLDRTEPRRREVDLPSPITGRPLRAVDQFTLARYEMQTGDTGPRILVIQWSQTLDPAELPRVMREIEEHVRERTRLQPGTSQPPIPKTIEARIDGRYEVPLDGARLPTFVEVRRLSSSDRSGISDTLRYVRTR
jgi:hypothetical protein